MQRAEEKIKTYRTHYNTTDPNNELREP